MIKKKESIIKGKKVLIGICGLGFGHSLREKVIVDYFIEQGADLCLVLDGKSSEFYHKYYPQIKKVDARIPFIACDKNGMDYKMCLERNIGTDFFRIEMETYGKIDNLIGTPDLVISDYEPYSARYSYINSVKLINLQQQSKYSGYKMKEIEGCSRNEEASRLRYFFPKSDKTLSASFFEIKDPADSKDKVIIVGPVIDKALITKKNEVKSGTDNVLVYFSPFTVDEGFMQVVQKMIANSRKQFNVFCDVAKAQPAITGSNVRFLPYSRDEYLSAFFNSDYVIANAGHQFMSEAIFLGKPMFVYPFYTYDQHYCANIVEELGIGVNIQNRSNDFFFSFEDKIEQMRMNIQNYVLTTNYEQRVNDILTILEEELTNEQN